jgi:hypothetical protein
MTFYYFFRNIAGIFLLARAGDDLDFAIVMFMGFTEGADLTTFTISGSFSSLRLLFNDFLNIEKYNNISQKSDLIFNLAPCKVIPLLISGTCCCFFL